MLWKQRSYCLEPFLRKRVWLWFLVLVPLVLFASEGPEQIPPSSNPGCAHRLTHPISFQVGSGHSDPSFVGPLMSDFPLVISRQDLEKKLRDLSVSRKLWVNDLDLLVAMANFLVDGKPLEQSFSQAYLQFLRANQFIVKYRLTRSGGIWFSFSPKVLLAAAPHDSEFFSQMILCLDFLFSRNNAKNFNSSFQLYTAIQPLLKEQLGLQQQRDAIRAEIRQVVSILREKMRGVHDITEEELDNVLSEAQQDYVHTTSPRGRSTLTKIRRAFVIISIFGLNVAPAYIGLKLAPYFEADKGAMAAILAAAAAPLLYGGNDMIKKRFGTIFDQLANIAYGPSEDDRFGNTQAKINERERFAASQIYNPRLAMGKSLEQFGIAASQNNFSLAGYHMRSVFVHCYNLFKGLNLSHQSTTLMVRDSLSVGKVTRIEDIPAEIKAELIFQTYLACLKIRPDELDENWVTKSELLRDMIGIMLGWFVGFPNKI